MTWTETRIDRLKTLHSEGWSGSQIAFDLGGLTRSAVIAKLHRLGLAKGPKMKPRKSYVVSVPTQPRVFNHIRFEQLCVAPPNTQAAVVDIDIPLKQCRSFMQLTDSTCRWPVGDPGNADFFFCGAVPADDKPYCPAHCRVAYQPRGKAA